MSIETLGAYSPSTIYGQFTMPFDDKPVHINGHTFLEEETDEEEFVSKTQFYNNNADLAVNVEDIHNMTGLELDAKIASNVIQQPVEFPPKGLVETFQASSFNDGNGVVFMALRNGYTGQTAIKIANAHNAYTNSMYQLSQNPIEYLSGVSYKAS